ncbi:alanyl-tRNA editing protein [Klebsiella sp. I138]|uniref:alanyl-tRNA editing protein n=1 Tax=Klebsiella sp. I138 TaxID=2755385 RepID=UPI003DAA17FD
MTERLYYTHDETEARAQVLRCQTEADGRYAIELDQTLFHPQGGGQPSDRGWIGEVAVESVVARGDSVMHIVAQPLPPGEVVIRVDESTRQLHARLHSAGHLIGLAGERCGWHPTKAHHWPGEGRITFSAAANAAMPEASALLAMIAGWQAENLPRHLTYEDGLRRVGFGLLPAYPCGGTHVASLSELGSVTITQMKMKKGQLIVSYTLE